MASRNEHIADLLMSAAYADQHLEGEELEVVRKLLAKAMRAKRLPPAMVKRLDGFDPKGFDLKETGSKLKFMSRKQRRMLVEFVAQIHEADGVWDLDEDAYLHQVAEALRLKPKEYEDLAVGELILEDAGDELLES